MVINMSDPQKNDASAGSEPFVPCYNKKNWKEDVTGRIVAIMTREIRWHSKIELEKLCTGMSERILVKRLSIGRELSLASRKLASLTRLNWSVRVSMLYRDCVIISRAGNMLYF